jgi:hypothetical protein
MCGLLLKREKQNFVLSWDLRRFGVLAPEAKFVIDT